MSTTFLNLFSDILDPPVWGTAQRITYAGTTIYHVVLRLSREFFKFFKQFLHTTKYADFPSFYLYLVVSGKGTFFQFFIFLFCYCLNCFNNTANKDVLETDSHILHIYYVNRGSGKISFGIFHGTVHDSLTTFPGCPGNMRCNDTVFRL